MPICYKHLFSCWSCENCWAHLSWDGSGNSFKDKGQFESSYFRSSWTSSWMFQELAIQQQHSPDCQANLIPNNFLNVSSWTFQILQNFNDISCENGKRHFNEFKIVDIQIGTFLLVTINNIPFLSLSLIYIDYENLQPNPKYVYRLEWSSSLLN